MTGHLRLVGGTDMGDAEAPAVWEDDHEGVARLLRGVREWCPSFVAVVAGKPDGSIKVFSNFDTAEGSIGFLSRGTMHLHEWCTETAAERSDEGDDA